MKYLALFPAVLVSIFMQSCSSSKTDSTQPESTTWRFELQVDSIYSIPFMIELDSTKENAVQIFNGEEIINVKDYHYTKDSLYIKMPIFHSEILATYNANLDQYIGHMPVPSVNGHYVMDLKGYRTNRLFKQPSIQLPTNFDGNLKTVFYHEDSTQSVGITLLKSLDSNRIQGTVMKATGDYRFLPGTITKDSLFMACFDGSHAFLFAGKIEGDTIFGEFFSKKSSRRKFKMWEDDSFELPNAETLTFLENPEEKFTVSIEEIGYTFPTEATKGKVHLLQIMGSWCPNCMDETRYLKEVYEKYHAQGLEITGFSFEKGATPEERKAKIDNYVDVMEIPYPVLEAGELANDRAQKVFHQLNHVMSYPTLIVVDKQGKVVKIHTGFAGPATGIVYESYVSKMDDLLQKLLNE